MLCYDSHPGFKTKFKPYQIDDQLIDQINNLIRDKALFNALENIDILFSEMYAQADIYESEFLKELNEKVKFIVTDLITQSPKNHNASNELFLQKFLMGSFSSSDVEKILEIANHQIRFIRENINKGAITREDKSISEGRELKKILKIINTVFKNSGVLKKISDYMGGSYIAGSCSLEISNSANPWWNDKVNIGVDTPQTLYAHLDESIKFPKSILYLSNVNNDSGPTSCYPGIYESLNLNPLQESIGRVIGTGIGLNPNSILKDYYGGEYYQSTSSKNFRMHFMRLPGKLRFNSHFGWDVIPGSELEKKMISCETKLLADSGGYIVFDGANLVHRGGMVNSGERIAIQIIFEPKLKLHKKIIKFFYGL
jgi:hypothetical protein